MHRAETQRLKRKSGLERALNNHTSEFGEQSLKINFENILRDIARMENENSSLLRKIKKIVDSGEKMRTFSNAEFFYLYGVKWFLDDSRTLKESVTIAVRECVVTEEDSIFLICPIREDHPFHKKAFGALNSRGAIMCQVTPEIHNVE